MSTQVKQIVCINCPRSCTGTVVVKDGNPTEIKGYACAIGRDYAAEEAVAPKRWVTSTMQVIGGEIKLLPVMSGQPVPKDKVREAAKALAGVRVAAPVAAGAVVAHDVLGLGIDFLAQREVKKL